MHVGMWPEHTGEERLYLFVHVRKGESMERDRAVYARASALQVRRDRGRAGAGAWRSGNRRQVGVWGRHFR